MDNPTGQNSETQNQPQAAIPAQDPPRRFKIDKEHLRNGVIVFIVIGLLAGLLYWYKISQRIYTDKAEISAPTIILGPNKPGVLEEILVKEGEQVAANQAVARMENDIVRAKTDGTIVSVNDQVGKLFSPGTAVVTMINPDDLRVVAHVEEDKGLADIRPGQRVVFTVDAFGSKEFSGTVEEVSPTADQTSVVFSISDKRAENEFSVKIKYEAADHQEFLNGMSAKVWIYK